MSGVAAYAIDAYRRSRARLSAHTISLIGLVVYVVATVVLVSSDGIPLSRDLVFGWILVGMLAVSLADLRGWARGVFFDWLPFFGILLGYDFLRGQIGSNPLFSPHVLPQIRVDEFLFGSVPTVDLQARLFDPAHIDWLDIASWGVYITHFFTVFVIAATLWRVSRPLFLEFRAMVITLTAAAFATYALFPAAPPWMGYEDGQIGPVHRIVGDVWRHLGAGSAAAIWDHGSAFSNEVAALPSLHTAYPVLILCFFWRFGWPARAICLFYAFAMSFALVYAGEHYVADVLLGWVYAITVFLVVGAIRRAWARRSERRDAGLQASEPV
jgi:membrane-associated phospholipid phosphatase